MNYPHSTRKLALAVAVASSVLLAGCDIGNDDVVVPPPSETTTFEPGVAPRFNPFISDVPFNIDLLFSGTTDGTALVNQPDNAVVSALNDLDGFSTTAYFDIAYDGSIDPLSVVAKGGVAAGQNVFLVPLDTGTGDALDFASIVGPDVAAATAFTFSKVSASVVSLDGGTNNVLRVAPEEPLLPAKKYLVFTTNTITDAAGNPTTSSGSYFAIKDTTNTLLNPALLPVRSLINNAWEAVAGGFIQAVSGGAITADAAKDSITVAYSFTTTDPHKPLLAMAAPRAALLSQKIATEEVQVEIAGEIAAQMASAPVQSQIADLTALLMAGDPELTLEAAQAQATQTVLDNVTEAVIDTTKQLILAELATLDAGLTLMDPDRVDGLSTPKAREIDIRQMARVDISDLAPPGALDPEVANLYTGYIKLPSYLSVANPAVDFDPSFLVKNWEADLGLASAIDAEVPADSDGTYNVTYRYPFAEPKAMEAVPLQVTMPHPDVVATAYQGTPLEGLSCSVAQSVQGNPGYPVVMYIHGITSDRTSVVALAHSLASQCVATVAIDLPVHGVAATSPYADGLNIERAPFAALYADAEPRERHYNIYSNNNTPAPMQFAELIDPLDPDAGMTAAVGGSGGFFINLGRLQNTRDNLRQGVMDMLNLNASLGEIAKRNLDGDNDSGTPLFDLTKVYVVGVSLGGAVGTVFTSVNQQAIEADLQAGAELNLNPIAGFVASTPASQLAQVIINSEFIGPQIVAGLAANDVVQGTSDFEKFAYVAQSTVDSGDPVNFAKSLQLSGVPALIQQIVGGGDASLLGDTKVYTADKVVPNSVAGVPLVGTTPLAALMGAELVGPGAQDLTAGNGLVNLTIGHHASLLRPSEDGVAAATTGENIATAELQTQVVSFVLSAASQVAVGSAPSNTNTAAQFIEAPAP